MTDLINFTLDAIIALALLFVFCGMVLALIFGFVLAIKVVRALLDGDRYGGR